MTTSCKDCFYETFNKTEFPCMTCSAFKNYVHKDVYLKVSEQTNERAPEPSHDAVESPQHYMLFPEQDIEVRDVVNKLLERMDATEKYYFDARDFADYAQLMQYLMRFMDKGGLEDLKKGYKYLGWIIENWTEDHESPDA